MKQVITRIATAGALLAVAAAAAAQGTTELKDPGPIRHAGSATVFNAEAAGFKRMSAVKYDDPSGEDIGASYSATTPQGRIVLTAYVYPAPPASDPAKREAACREEFEGAAASIEKHPQAKKIGELPAHAQPGVPARLALRSSYDLVMPFDGRAQAVTSDLHLYCYVRGNWFVKYRVSAPKGVPLDAATAKFIAAGPWPGR